MSRSWKATTIGAQVLLQRGIDITRNAQRSGLVPVVSSGGISSYHDTPAAKGPGVVLGRKGVVGSVYFVKEDYWPHDTTLWVRDFKGNDERFVYYFFKARARELAALDVGSANPTLNRNHVHPTAVSWPPLHEQRAIGRVLGSLDDKIDFTRRMRQTLEAMTSTLFKSWVVDFDPVYARAEGRQVRGIDAVTATLFPAAFEDSDTELGPVPCGWMVRSLYDCAEWINGAAYRDFEFSTDRRGLPIVRIAELKNGITAQTRFTVNSPGEKYRIDSDDVLFSWSGNPDTSIDTFIWAHGPAWLNQHIFKVIPPSAAHRTFLVCLLRHLRPVFAELARDKQTTGLGHVTAGDMRRLRIATPPAPVVAKLHEIAGPLLRAAQTRTLESLRLEMIRDSLLPRLVSGEVLVRHAERIVKEAV